MKDRLIRIVADRRPRSAASADKAHLDVVFHRCDVIPFPPFRPRQYVEELARQMLSVDQHAAENILSRDLRIIEEDLIGAGADPGAVQRALVSLERGVRAELWRQMFGNEI
jgi:hypothetical protein